MIERRLKMSKEILTWQKEAGRWLNRLRFRTTWRRYADYIISYSEYKDEVFYIVNTVRARMGDEPFSRTKFEEGWQWLVLAHEKYNVAYGEMLNLIFGWW
jgi:hypothetical protein